MNEIQLKEIREEFDTHGVPNSAYSLITEIRRLRTALEWIAGPCKNYTRGTDCLKEGRIIDTIYGAERVCDACIARDAIVQQPNLFHP